MSLTSGPKFVIWNDRIEKGTAKVPGGLEDWRRAGRRAEGGLRVKWRGNARMLHVRFARARRATLRTRSFGLVPIPDMLVYAKNDPSKPIAAFYELRKLAIIAMFSDDVLLDQLVLKGGNALDIVLGIGGRTSRDIDFSVGGEFSDLEDIRSRVESVINDRFDSAGYKVFDFRCELHRTVRREDMPPQWGGCKVEFGVIKKSEYEKVKSDRAELLKRAEAIGPVFQKRLTIQISNHEYTTGKIEKELDDNVVVVYTPQMIALEKLRAICQQMAKYGMRGPGAPRARDFYDIYRIRRMPGVSLDDDSSRELLGHMFAAREVPLELLKEVEDHREFHRGTWSEVVEAARDSLESFDHYFDDVLELIDDLELFGDE